MSSTAGDAFERARSRGETAFVALVWAGCALSIALLIGRYAPTIPFYDDAALADFMEPYMPRGEDFFLLPHNEHLVPVTRLLFAWALDVTGSFRAGSWFQLAILALVSLALLVALRRRTSSTRASDALVPLVLLSLGGAENFLSPFQIAVTLPVAIAAALLAGGLLRERAPGWRGIAVFWIAMVAMLGCSVVGWVGAVVLSLVPAGVGLHAWLKRPDGWRATLASVILGAIGFAALAIALLRAAPGVESEAPTVARFVDVTLGVLATAIGSAAATYWPWSFWICIALYAAALAILVRALGNDALHARAALVLVVLLSGVAIAGAIAWGRGATSEQAGFAGRYQPVGALPLCAAYVGARVFGKGAFAWCTQLLMFACALAMWSTNYYDGVFREGIRRHTIALRYHRAVESGAGLQELTSTLGAKIKGDEARFGELYHVWRRGGFADDILPGERREAADPLAIVDPRPAAVESACAPAARVFGERDALLVCAPAHVEIEVPGENVAPRLARLHVAFDPLGFDPRVVVTVRAIGADGASTAVLERELAPRERPEDEGWQALELRVEPERMRRLIVEVAPAGTSPSPRYVLFGGITFDEQR